MLPAKPSSHERDVVSMVVEEYHEVNRVNRLLFTAILECMRDNRSLRQRRLNVRPYRIIERVPAQVPHLTRLVGLTDVDCINNLRMDRNTFGRLCILLRERTGLIDERWVKVEEQVAMFLGVLAHHSKNRIVGFNFRRSLQTISHYIHSILSSILQLHGDLLVTPEPVNDGCTDPRWKCFPGCFGALDGTYINVTVSNGDKARYRTRKGQISTNVLAVCDRKLRFVYVLSGWEGSAGDSRILRDAINRPNGLKVPKGSYYLCDNGYANSDGFLTPYKGVRYHLKEWGPNAIRPHNPTKLFNMRHKKARNVIERAFGVMKMRWGILRSPSYYPIEIQNRLIMTCFLLHNFIRGQMDSDPFEMQLEPENLSAEDVLENAEVDFVETVDPTAEWTEKRDNLVISMWNQEHGVEA